MRSRHEERPEQPQHQEAGRDEHHVLGGVREHPLDAPVEMPTRSTPKLSSPRRRACRRPPPRRGRRGARAYVPFERHVAQQVRLQLARVLVRLGVRRFGRGERDQVGHEAVDLLGGHGRDDPVVLPAIGHEHVDDVRAALDEPR
jgi:hypothetical protein